MVDPLDSALGASTGAWSASAGAGDFEIGPAAAAGCGVGGLTIDAGGLAVVGGLTDEIKKER